MQIKNNLTTGYILPNSVEAEQSVLGGLMLDDMSWDKIADILVADDFYCNEHKIIFESISDLVNNNKPIDTINLNNYLKNKNLIDRIGGELYVYDLCKNIPSAANILSYAVIVREKSILRKLISAGNFISENALNFNGNNISDIIDNAEKRIFSITEHNNKGAVNAVSIKSLLASAVKKIDENIKAGGNITGLTTGFIDIDNITSGLQSSDLIVVAGRPSMGKTAFAMNIAENAAIETKKPILIFSMEMAGDAIAMRMISSLGRIDQHNIKIGNLSDNEWKRIISTSGLLSTARIFIDDAAALSPTELRSRARRLVRDQGEIGLIIVDYLQLMQVSGFKENRTTEISEISRSLKALAKELNVPIIALSQLNRSLEQRVNKRPVMSDLRESGAIEQDADLIMFIYRDEVYNENSIDRGTAEIIIAKQRNGPIGKRKLTFLNQFTRFENFTENSWD